MGGAAALIPGIVGIAGGEYAGYKKRQGEEEMQRRQAASLGRFLDPNLEAQPVRNSMGIGAPNIEQRQALAPDMMGGDATRRAIQARTPDARLNRFALEQYLTGNKAIANKLIEQRLVPGQKKYINIMDQNSGAISSIPEDQPIPFGFAIAGEAKQPEGFKVGATRDVKRGNEVVTEEWDGTKFVEIARGSAFAPQKGETPFNPLDPKVIRAEEDKAMDLFKVASAELREVQSSHKVLTGLLDQGTALSITYAIKGLERAFEPGTIVRPADVQAISDAQGLIDQLNSLKEKYKTGIPANDPLIQQIRNVANSLYLSKQQSYADYVRSYEPTLKERGVDIMKVAPLLRLTPAPPYVPTMEVPKGGPGVATQVTRSK